MCSTDIFLGLLAVLFPPLPVWVKRGICSADSVINILLLMLGYLPGLLHAWYIIAQYPEPPYDYEYQAVPGDAEQGRVYVYVHGGGPGPGAPPSPQTYHGAQPNPQGHMNYGTAGAPSAGPPAAVRAPPPPAAYHHPPQEQGTTIAAAGPSDNEGPPPSYAQVVAGDHKIQTRD